MQAVEFGPPLLYQILKTMTQTPTQAKRNGQQAPPTETYVRKIAIAINRIFPESVSRKAIPTERSVVLE